MELRQLRYFVGVSEAGSLLKASRVLHVAQPALGQQMATLEAELGTPLFVRSSRGMALTPAGRKLLEHARIVLAAAERARIAVQQSDDELTGDVSIGMPTSVALMATVPLLQAIRSRFPRIVPRVVESHSGFVREWLQAGRLDLCMLFGIEDEAWLLQKPLLREELCLVGPRRGRRRSLPPTVPLRKLADYPMFLSARGHGLRHIIDDACLRHGVRLNVIGHVDSLPNIKKAVEAGLAYTLLSPAAAAEEVAQRRLETAPITGPAIQRTVVYATSLMRPLTPAAAAVGELVCERVRALVTEGHWPALLERG